MQESKPLASCIVVVPQNSISPLGKYEDVSWLEVMQHIAKRLRNINPKFEIEVMTDKDLKVQLTWLAH